jgi:hypothetical protein
VSLARLSLALFVVAQVFDGLFTYAAVSVWGPRAEANALVATWITLVGPAAALAGAKLLATGCAVVLYSRSVHWALTAATLMYFAGAVVPWLVMFRTF